ncbi:hypothetical protein [Paenibacillus sp. JJ-100]|uniref:hypothetical protein n=1 Tax=Paenibacillus sp. JJ-100 TaxID=2974896 RepID=UPI00232BBB42|nr:hypothetical protein [Paenibacillus sp. JJ-100]
MPVLAAAYGAFCVVAAVDLEKDEVQSGGLGISLMWTPPEKRAYSRSFRTMVR